MTKQFHMHFCFLGMIILSGVHLDSFYCDLEEFQSSYRRAPWVCTLILIWGTWSVPWYMSAYPPAATGNADSRVICILKSPGNLDRLSQR